MKLFNTMTRKKEEFIPIKEGKVSIYVCGPTVYNYIHIGNARPLIVYDTLRKYFEYQGYEVTFVQNCTDIDDKLITRAAEENTTVKELAEKYINEYEKDAKSLCVALPTYSPRATLHIPEIIALIDTLIKNGNAYAADNGDVYFSVRSFDEYGKLSGQSVESLESGARIDPTEHKHDPLDFALWKSAKPGEPKWDAPWGSGRPGWHIECSAMSMKILGQTFDIHAGGVDLVFPHHENEIAQSEAATHCCFAHYWLHNGLININNQKMSKSKGGFFTVRDILAEFSPDALRLFMLGAHYRSPFNFSRELMEQGETALSRIKTAKERLFEAKALDTATDADAAFIEKTKSSEAAFIEAMDDDFNTADALGIFFDYIRALNTFVSEPRGKAALDLAKEFFGNVIKIFGILQNDAAEVFPEEALALLQKRTEAKRAKDYALSDAVRDELKAMGFAVTDTPEGAKLSRIK